ncbi:hypothetical protein C1Y40_00171 [Mycobacterium talmoniae]|uniref:Uncharacterized protein n=1 Tax=Mycobacterium talmoniae TaxID=1858794 RepID=A0A2S8BSJ4_9MYCO|nr:hypothetical protein C1Y40_00171 [Mycobacterium talmoniae]
MAPNLNLAVASVYPYDKDTHTAFNSGPVPQERAVYSFFEHTDLSKHETSGLQQTPVDPASYHPLAAGQMILVPGSRGAPTINDAMCAADPDDTLTCEMQNAWGRGETHGFRLSPHGSRAY